MERTPYKPAAKHGEKMITMTVYFWTNDIAGQKGRISRKQAWAAGMVAMDANPSHGIKPRKTRPFHSLMDLTAAMEKVLIEHGIVLHEGPKMRKYLKGRPSS
jgi:hypothetical protein